MTSLLWVGLGGCIDPFPDGWGEGDSGTWSTTETPADSGDSGIAEEIEASPGHRLAVGQFNACWIDDSGTLDCWGYNSEVTRDVPTGTYVDVAVGYYYACSVREDGVPFCWGTEGAYATPPVPMGVLTRIETGTNHSCALDELGQLSCWGQTEDDHIENPDGRQYEIGLDGTSTCAVLAKDKPECWGYGASARANLNSYSGEFAVVQLDGGVSHQCAVLSNGSMACWGDDTYGKTDPTPGQDWIQVSSGPENSCGLSKTGGLSCWGNDATGINDAPGDGAFAEVAVGYHAACAITTQGSVSCWGVGNGYDIPEGP